MESGAPFAMALIILAVIFDLQTSCQETGTQDTHSDRQFFTMTSCTCRYTPRAVISTVSTCCSIPCSLFRFNLFASYAEGPANSIIIFRVSFYTIIFLIFSYGAVKYNNNSPIKFGVFASLRC